MAYSRMKNHRYRFPWIGEQGSSQRIILLLLVLLFVVFGYLYLFTGLIRAPEEASNPSAAKTSYVKQSIPVRSKVKDEKSVAPVRVKDEEPRASKLKSIPVLAPKVQSATLPDVTVKPLHKKSASIASVERGIYTLLVGEFVLAKSVEGAQFKLRKAGIGPVIKKSVRRQASMNRLFMVGFSDRKAAEVELKALKKLAADAFLLLEDGKYVVCAGSYYMRAQAVREQDRLYDKGVKLVMKKVDVPIKLTRVTAGSFATREKALKAVASLKKQGLAAHVVKSGN